MNFPERLKADAALIEARLAAALAGKADQPVTDAMRYAVRGGKRLRGFLVLEGARMLGVPEARAIAAAAAVEALHAYSLVHDDLPCMDDDDLRRGKPSLHVAYDEATAILVGDGLQARAFELLAEAPGVSDAQRIAMIRVLAAAAGLRGMVGGQYIDTQAVDSDMNLRELQAMHALKTGALIRAALALGAIAAGASAQQLSALDAYGTHIGLAFQVVDDVLDVEGDTQTLGKTRGKDSAANKPTYVKLLGLDGAKAEAKRLMEAAIQALAEFGESADLLRDLARYIVARDH